MKTLYESILDSDAMDKMEDDLIRHRIREYCKYKLNGNYWPIARSDIRITNVDKDSKGWYVDTEPRWNGDSPRVAIGYQNTSFLDYCATIADKKNNWTDFVVNDHNGPELHFRWRKHKGSLDIISAQNLDSTDGLPEEFDMLQLIDCCQQSKKFDVKSKLNILYVNNTSTTTNITGNVKNVIVSPNTDYTLKNSSQIRVFKPTSRSEFNRIIKKLLH